MLRKTKSTITALERLVEASGMTLLRDGDKFKVRMRHDITTRPHNSARTLAGLARVLFREHKDTPKWEELRDATRYDPGSRRRAWSSRKMFEAATPVRGIAAWEEDALQRLAITEVD